MKTLSANQETERANADQAFDLFWFALIEWGGTVGDQWVGTGAVEVDPGTTTEDLMVGAPEFGMQIAASPRGKFVGGQASMILRNDYEDVAGVWAKCQAVGAPEGRRVTIYSAFIRSDGAALAEADWRLHGIFEIDEYPSLTSTRAGISLAGLAESIGEEAFGREISTTLFPAYSIPSASLGRLIPRPYGVIEKAPGIPLDMGYSTSLTEDVDATSMTLYVYSVERFPATGTLVVGAEEIVYLAAETAGGGYGARFLVAPGGRGANGTEAADHGSGSAVREKRSSYRWIVADGELWALVDKTVVGDTTSGSAVIANLEYSTAILAVGDAVSGLGIPAGTSVASIDAVDQVTLSANATATAADVDLRFTRTVRAYLGGLVAIDVEVLVEDLDGTNATFLTADALPAIGEYSPTSEVTLLDGAAGNWSDAGSTSDSYLKAGDPVDWRMVENSGEGAIDGTEDAHVTFALLDPMQGKILLALEYANDLSGRVSALIACDLYVVYRVLPNENLPAGATEFPWDNWQIVLTRDGVEIVRADLGRPAIEDLRGLLDQTTFLPGIEDSRPLFGVTGLGDQTSAGSLVILEDCKGQTFLYQGTLGHAGFYNWPDLSDNPVGLAFASSTTVSKFYSLTGDPPAVGGVKKTNPLRLAPTWGPNTRTITKLRVEVDLTKQTTVAGYFQAEIRLNGRDDVVANVRMAEGEESTLIAEYESPNVEIASGTCDTVEGYPTVGNCSVDTKDLKSGTLVIGAAFHTGTRIVALTGSDSFEIDMGARGTQTGGPVTFANPFVRETVPIADVRDVTLFAYTRNAVDPWATKADSLAFLVRAARVTYWTTDETNLVGIEVPLETVETDIADALLMASSRDYAQRVKLTAHVADVLNYADPWDFFAETLEVQVMAPAPTSSTRIMVSDVRFEVKERPLVERAPTEEELELTLDIAGGIYADAPVRAGAWTGPGYLERPEDVIYDWLTSVMGLSADEIDLADDAWGGLLYALRDRQDWKFARAIAVAKTKREIAEEMFQDAGLCPVFDGGRMRFVGSLTPNLLDVVATLGEGTRLGETLVSHGARAEIYNQLGAYWRRSFGVEGDFAARETFDDAESQADYGRAFRQTIDYENIRDLATARELSQDILSRFGRRNSFVLSTHTAAAIHLEVGDPVLLVDSYNQVDSVPGVIVAREAMGGVNFRFNAVQAAARVRVWEAPADATTYIDVYPVAGRMVFVFEGLPIATLDGGARWSLLGAVETVATSGGSQTDMIEKGVGGIDFGLDTGAPSRHRLLSLTSAGDMTVWGNGTVFGRYFSKPQWPVLSAHSDYIEEFFGGTLPAVISFSVDLRYQAAKLAGDVVGGQVRGGITAKAFRGSAL